MKEPEILYEDQEIWVVVKPPGYESQESKGLSLDLVNFLKSREKKARPEQTPYVGVVHRLDKPVGGLLVYAKNPKAAAFLSEKVGTGFFNKEYLTRVRGEAVKSPLFLTDRIVFDRKTGTSRIAPEGKEARLLFTPLSAEEAITCARAVYTRFLLPGELEEEGWGLVRLFTGRHHQIRVQLSHAGHPLCGDRRYGKEESGPLLLFAVTLSFPHPKTKKEMTFTLLP